MKSVKWFGFFHAARKSQVPSSPEPEPEHEEEEESPESPDPEHVDQQESGGSDSGDSASNSGTLIHKHGNS